MAREKNRGGFLGREDEKGNQPKFASKNTLIFRLKGFLKKKF